MNKKKVSIVIPIFNEEEIIQPLLERLNSVLKDTNYKFDFIFVNDGSTDGSLQILFNLAKQDKKIKIIDLSRNFGQQLALSAGIDYSDSDAVVLMDADMEDNPEDLVKFLNKWEEGYDVVYAIRKKRKTSIFKKVCFNAFYFLNKFLSEVPLAPSGIFGLMDKKVVDKMRILKEHSRFIPGLRSWVGFKQTGIELERGQRYDRKARVSFGSLIVLAFNSYFSFSKKPLLIASALGIFLSFASFFVAILIIIFQLAMKFKVPGWASLVSIILFISGLQFICFGIMGEYIGRIFEETKGRPLYIIKDIYDSERK